MSMCTVVMEVKGGVKLTQAEIHIATYVWFIVNYLNYGPWQTNFAADYSQTVWVIEVSLGKGHAQTVFQRFSSRFGCMCSQ